MTRLDVFRESLATLSPSEFVSRFEQIVTELQTELKVLTFALLLYDETTPEFRKQLRDSDYWDALEAVSGRHLLVLSISDRRDAAPGSPKDAVRDWMATLKGSSTSLREGYSYILRQLFENNIPLRFPSLLLFQVTEGTVFDYRLIDLSGTLSEVQTLLTLVATTLEHIDPQFYGNQEEIFRVVEGAIDNARFQSLVLNGPHTLLDLLSRLRRLLSLA